MPEDQKDEAFDDQPVRLDRDFNISAPRALPRSARHLQTLSNGLASAALARSDVPLCSPDERAVTLQRRSGRPHNSSTCAENFRNVHATGNHDYRCQRVQIAICRHACMHDPRASSSGR